MPDDLLEEIRALRETLNHISRRLEILEQRAVSRSALAARESPASVSAPPPAPIPRPHPVSAPSPLADRGPSPPAATSPRENLELKIGRYWLNRVGILSLVLGTAFFLVYSIQYLGPAAKVAMGYAVGASLMVLGVRLERKPGIEWYARGLLGGAWAVLYFTTYAMYHVPETKVLHSAPLDLLLLLVVAAGAVRHALTYRSQTITMLAFLLGFLTTGISEVTYFTFASSVILIGSLVGIAARMRWHGLLLYGMVGSYFTHLVAVQGHVVTDSWTYLWANTPAQEAFWLHASFLALYWIGYTIGVLVLDEREESRRNTLLTTTIVNGLAFTLLLLPRIAPVYSGAGYIALLVIGAVYLVLSPVAGKRGLAAVSTAHLLLGLTLMTLAIPQKLTHRSTSFVWMAEIGLLAWVGVLFDRWAYRIFSLALGYFALMYVFLEMGSTDRLVVFGYGLSWRWAVGGTAIVCYAVAAAASRHLEPRRFRWPLERQSFHLYSAAACIVLWILTTITSPFRTVPLNWAIEASAITLLGWVLKDRGIRMFGFLWFLPAVSVVFGSLGTGFWFWSLKSALMLIATLYAMSMLHRGTPPAPTFAIERHLTNIYVVTASLLLAGVLWHDIARNWLSLAWALEGLALVVIGFRLPDKYYRVSGLAIFSILLLKVLFVDLAAAETIYRILSFAVAGAILLLASFGYAKFTGKESKPEA